MRLGDDRFPEGGASGRERSQPRGGMPAGRPSGVARLPSPPCPILPGRGPEVPGGCRVIQAPRFWVFDVGIVNELARRGTRSAPADSLLVVGMPSLPSVIGMGPLDSSGRKRMPGPEVASKCSTVGARVSGVAPLGGGPRGAGAAAVPEREGNPIVDSAGRKPAATLRHLRPLVTRLKKRRRGRYPRGCRPRSGACVTFFLSPGLPLPEPL